MKKHSIAFFAMALSLAGLGTVGPVQGGSPATTKDLSPDSIRIITDAATIVVKRNALLKKLGSWESVFLSCIQMQNGMDQTTRQVCEKRSEYWGILDKTKQAKTEKEIQTQELAFQKLADALKKIQPTYLAGNKKQLIAAKKNIQGLDQKIRPATDAVAQLNKLYTGRAAKSESCLIFAQKPDLAVKRPYQVSTPALTVVHKRRIPEPPSPNQPAKTTHSSAQQKKQIQGSGLYDEIIASAASRYGLSTEVLRAVIAAKSRYNANLHGAGTHGLMGISEAIANAYGYKMQNIYDPAVNIDIGARLLSQLLKQFHGDLHRALAAYQVGPAAVIRSRGIPNDKNVKDFLAAFERAYRGTMPKPPVKQIVIKKPSTPKIVVQEVEAQVQELSEYLKENWAPKAGAAFWRPLITKIADAFGVDAKLMEAMVQQESKGNPKAVSKKGAAGLGQLMPDTAADLGVKDPFDPVQNLKGMAKYLKQLLKQYDGNKVLATAAYNAGPKNVKKAKNNIPNFHETKNYVMRVTSHYEKLGGENLDRLMIFHMPEYELPESPRNPSH